MAKNNTLLIVVIAIAMFAASIFIINTFSKGVSSVSSEYVSCVSVCNGGANLQVGVMQSSLFPICFCEATKSSITLKMNTKQQTDLEQFHNACIKENVNASLIQSLTQIKKAAIDNNSDLYEIEVKKFDAEWNALSSDIQARIMTSPKSK